MSKQQSNWLWGLAIVSVLVCVGLYFAMEVLKFAAYQAQQPDVTPFPATYTPVPTPQLEALNLHKGVESGIIQLPLVYQRPSDNAHFVIKEVVETGCAVGEAYGYAGVRFDTSAESFTYNRFLCSSRSGSLEVLVDGISLEWTTDGQALLYVNPQIWHLVETQK